MALSLDNFDWQGFGANALTDLGYGLTQGKNLGQALGVATQRTAELGPQRQAAYQSQKKAEQSLNKTIEFMQAKGYTDLVDFAQANPDQIGQAWNEALRRSAPKEGLSPYEQQMQQYDLQRAELELAQMRNGGGGQVNYSTQPVWGKDARGNDVLLQVGDNGTGVQTQMPEGVQVMAPRELNIERAAGTAIGGAVGDQTVAAPGDIANADMALGLIDQIKNHPELPWATGRGAAFGMNDPRLNPQRFAFDQLVNQAKSGAFLTAIEQLRGMGALSNAEGAAATTAVTRINTALEKDDFLRAVEDYEQIVNLGKQRAQQRLPQQPAGGGQQPNFAPLPTTVPAASDLFTKYGLE